MKKLILFFIILCSPFLIFSQDRFPRPDFLNGYTRPEPFTILLDSWFIPYIDILVLIIVLIVSVYAVFRVHSRTWIFFISLFSLLYFGFYRKGCVCPIGSIQPVSDSLFNSGTTLPFSTILIFFIPIIFSLFFGRIFCGSACPLGAIQDLVSIKQLKLPVWLETPLKLIPPIFLALAILAAVMGSDYLICKWDPFVNFFKLTGNSSAFIYSGIFILLSIVIYRPYCRFLCPYGFLLKITSYFSLKHLSIATKQCINCKLCEGSCPMGEIHYASEDDSKTLDFKGTIVLLVFIPLLAFGGAFIGGRSGGFIAKLDYRVALANDIRSGIPGSFSDEITAFMNTGVSMEDLFLIEINVLEGYRNGSTIMGLFIGLLLGIKLLQYKRKNYYKNYEVDRAGCVSCGRCFESCPLEVSGGSDSEK